MSAFVDVEFFSMRFYPMQDRGIDGVFLPRFVINLFKNADPIYPWFIDRFNEDRIPKMIDRVLEDFTCCKQIKLDYVPEVYPGFSWHNLKLGSPFDQIQRNKVHFFRNQLSGVIENGAEIIQIRLFDELDEDTRYSTLAKSDLLEISHSLLFSTKYHMTPVCT